MVTLEKLRNITVFMRIAVEGGGLKTVNDVMAFAETLTEVNAAIEALTPKNPKIQEAVKKAVEGEAQ